MKGKKRIIVTLLFLINIIMLVAAIIPHHHHPNGMICMKQDLPVEYNNVPRIIIGKRFMLGQRMYDSFLLSHSIRTYG